MKKNNLFISIIFSITLISSCSTVESSSTVVSTSIDEEPLMFNDLYSFGDKLTADNISKVTINTDPGSICPPWLHYVYTNEETTYFERIINFIDDATFIPCVDPYEGVSGYSVGISTAINQYSLYFTDNDEFYVNGSIYSSSIEFPIRYSKDYFEYYSTYSDAVFNSFDTEQILSCYYSQSLLFVDSSTESDFYDFTKDASIVLDNNVCFTIEDNDTFYIDFDKYEIIGDTDFSELLTGIEDTTSFVRIYLESTDLLIKIKVSNNVEYSYDELFSKAMLNIESSENFELCTEDGTLYEGGQINSDSDLLMKSFIIE